jgi:Cu/Ag efflux pump CusA
LPPLTAGNSAQVNGRRVDETLSNKRSSIGPGKWPTLRHEKFFELSLLICSEIVVGIEGRLFAPLGIGYIVSILASMLVSMTVTPVLAYYLLPRMKQLGHSDSPMVRRLKAWDTRILEWSFPRAKPILTMAVLAVILAAATVPFFPRAFLPAFNEGSLVMGLTFMPGTSLAEANRMGALAETLIREVPEVTKVGRRTGRAELDEHAEGVHSSEIDVDLKRSDRDLEAVMADIRARPAMIPASVAIGQPISHRLDHLLSGVRAQVALKIYGDDIDTLQGLAECLRGRLAIVPGLVDLSVERQVLIPQSRCASIIGKQHSTAWRRDKPCRAYKRCPRAHARPRWSPGRVALT